MDQLDLMSQLSDTTMSCSLSLLKGIKFCCVFSAGMLCDAKELNKEAVQAFGNALDLEPNHVPSLISMAVVLRRLGEQSHAIVRSLLTDALRLDRMNPSAWNNLGLLYKAIGPSMSLDAADCFKAAALLEESAPVEPFR